ncbi:MAG: RpiB/LacA/LacB family sugar-phosphate isomerase [Verrucomicrobiota bacterium]
MKDWIDKSTIRLGIATDHGGLAGKSMILGHLQGRAGFELHDLGPHKMDPEDDYPDYAGALARRISSGGLDAGILVCRSGIGMSIVANRFPGVRAALVNSDRTARLSRTHNAANILVVGSENCTEDEVLGMVDIWLETGFSQEERHIRRIHKIETESAGALEALRDDRV